MATIHTLAADIADRIPAMALDGKLNNATLIERLLEEFLKQKELEFYIRLNSPCCD